MRNISVQEIVDEVQLLVEDPLHKLATEAQYIRRVNRANARLHAAYVACEPDRFRTEATITAVSGTAAYALPARWLTTIGIDAVNGTARYELSRLQEEGRNDYTSMDGMARAYRILAETVVLYPTPITGQTYTHIYMPAAPVITLLADVIDCRNGHEEYLEMVVARTLLKTENTYDGRWDDEIDKIELALKVESNWRYFTDCVTLQSHRNRRPFPYGTGYVYPALPENWL